MKIFSFPGAVSLVNGTVVTEDGQCSSVRFDTRVRALGERPARDDVVVDLDGAYVLPGLVNAHEHLELNHYGPLKARERYANASEWIDDLRPLLGGDPRIVERRSYPLADRLFIGGLKNVLAGVTTVAHHTPLYAELKRGLPLRHVTRFGWAHSFAMERQPVGAHGELGGGVLERCVRTPSGMPFILHLGEGVDREAAGELDRLQALRCLRSTTVVVHGVALTLADWRRVTASGAGLVWCPSSNHFLFGHTLPVRGFLDSTPAAWQHISLGTDSRITGSPDLLDEMRSAAALGNVTPAELLRMVSSVPARMLKLEGAGRIAVNGPADLLVVPRLTDDAAGSLLALQRSQVALVIVGGRPMVGNLSFEPVFVARRAASRRIVVDNVVRCADERLASRIARCPIDEPGVHVAA